MRTKRVVLTGVTLLLGGSALYVASGFAQTSPLEIIPLAQGFMPDSLKLHAKGPSAVLQVKMTVPPLAEIGWHTHAGTSIIVATQGTLTEYHANGCVSVHQPGSVIIEEEGEVHKIVNPSASLAAEGYATIILPPNAQPLIPVPEPRLGSCTPGQQRKR